MNNRLRNVEKITMDDIARNLDVSKTTVSRAISGKGRIGKETRDKILNYISSMGYKPNTMARALAGSKAYSIGVVIPGDDEKGNAPFFKDCLVGITEASAKRDYDTILVVVSNDNLDGLERLISNHKVDGIVLTRFDEHSISYLSSEEVPFILIGSDDRDDVLQIDINQKDCCREVVSKILETADKVALFAGSRNLKVDQTRYQGYSEAFMEKGLTVDESLVFWNVEDSLESQIDQILSAGVKAVAASDDVICAKLMDSLSKRGVQVPSQLKVVSFFDSDELENAEIPVTAVHVNTRKLSSMAGDLLIDVIDGKEPEHRNYVECSVLYRDSSR